MMTDATTPTKPESDTAEKLDFKKILPVFLIVLVDLLGLTIIIPLLPLYTVSLGADPFTIGLLSATYPLMQLIGGPLLGGLSDRFGRKPILIISQLGTFIGFLMLGFATALPVLFLSRLIDGISGANIVAAQAAITDSTTDKTRTQGLGLIGAAFGLGFVIGPAIAGIALAVSGNNYQVPALIAAGFSLLSILLTIFLFKETLTDEVRSAHQESHDGGFVKNLTRSLSMPLVAILLLLMFAQQLVFAGYENLFALFTLNRLGLNASGNAVIFVFIGIWLVIIQGRAIGPLSQKYGDRKLIYAGLAFLAVGMVLSAITPATAVPWYSQDALLKELSERSSVQAISVAIPSGDTTGWLGIVWLLAASIPTTIGASILSPSINSLITKQVASSQVGGTLGVSSALVSAANAITPLLGGAMFQWLGSTAPFLTGGLLMALLFLFAMTRIPAVSARQAQAAA